MDLNNKRSRLERLRESFATGLDLLGHVPRVVFNWTVEVSLLCGKIPGTDETAKMLYVGRGRNRAYLQGRVLRDADVISVQRLTLFSCWTVIRRLEQEADVVFIDIGIPYMGRFKRTGEYLVLPDWINMVIPIRGDWEQVESRFNKTTRKLVRRIPYRSELTRDPEVISRFYDEFYLPYLRLRHEDAVVESRRSVERRAQQGGILRVIGEDGPIVAGVVYPEDGVLYYLWLGMAERYLDQQPEGALAASYYFCLRYAFENSFVAANWMGTRSFPTDGVYQFKRKWGPLVEDSFSPDSILFRPARNNRAAIAFAQAFPVLARRDGGLEQIHCTTAETLTDVDINRLISGFVCDGIDRVTIVHVVEGATASHCTIRPCDAHPNVRVITTDVSGFARCYAMRYVSP